MIDISINNITHTFNDKTKLDEVLETLGYADQSMLGIALNKTFIEKNSWSNTLLNHQDQIDILTPISGG